MIELVVELIFHPSDFFQYELANEIRNFYLTHIVTRKLFIPYSEDIWWFNGIRQTLVR